jgi:hypothetical protein
VYPSPQQHIQKFIQTGRHEELPYGSIHDWLITERRAANAMREALVAEVQLRSRGVSVDQQADFHTLVKRKLKPMICGLFSKSEREIVLALLGDCIVLLTAGNIDDVLWRTSKLNTAWLLANLYLKSVGARTLGDIPKAMVGLSEDTTC